MDCALDFDDDCWLCCDLRRPLSIIPNHKRYFDKSNRLQEYKVKYRSESNKVQYKVDWLAVYYRRLEYGLVRASQRSSSNRTCFECHFTVKNRVQRIKSQCTVKTAAKPKPKPKPPSSCSLLASIVPSCRSLFITPIVTSNNLSKQTLSLFPSALIV